MRRSTTSDKRRPIPWLFAMLKASLHWNQHKSQLIFPVRWNSRHMNVNNTIWITLSVVRYAAYRFSRIHETYQSQLFIIVVIVLHITETHDNNYIISQAYNLATAKIKGQNELLPPKVHLHINALFTLAAEFQFNHWKLKRMLSRLRATENGSDWSQREESIGKIENYYTNSIVFIEQSGCSSNSDLFYIIQIHLNSLKNRTITLFLINK